MALQIRRGTDAERLTITPAEGELIYTTDTKLIYIGDGSTLGGTKADSGITDLISDTSPQLGGNLDLNSQTITGTGAIGITGNISGNTVAGSSGNFTSSVIGSLSAASIQGDLTGSVFADDSTMLVDGTDGKIVLSNNVIQDLSNVYVPTTPTAGDALIWNAVDSRWEAGNPAASGGVFDGDISGSVFGDDSVILVDGVNSRINGNNIYSADGAFFFIDDTATRTEFVQRRELPSIDSTLATYDIFVNRFEINDQSGIIPASFIKASNDAITIGVDKTGVGGSATEVLIQKDAFFIGTPIGGGRFNVNGDSFFNGNAFFEGNIRANSINANITGSDSTTWLDAGEGNFYGYNVNMVGRVSASELEGNLVAEDSTYVYDKATGAITAGGFVQFGGYNTTERNALTAANGMVIYNTQVNRFQGYQNGAWINIDDGTAA